MPSMVREYRQYRIAIYSPSDHFAVVTPPGGNSVIKFQSPARSSLVEGPLVCLGRAQVTIDGIIPDARQGTRSSEIDVHHRELGKD